MNAILERTALAPLLDGLTEAVILTDQTGTLVFANNAACARFDADRYRGMPLEKRLAEMPVFRPDGTPVSLTFLGKVDGEGAMLEAANAYQRATEWNKRVPTLKT